MSDFDTFPVRFQTGFEGNEEVKGTLKEKFHHSNYN
jgi:hypothetical protein